MMPLILFAILALIVLLAGLALLDARRFAQRRRSLTTRSAEAMRGRARELGADRPTGMTYIGRREE